MLERLDHSLGLLVGGSRDLPDRQQTLRSTIAWSHDLLGGGAQRLLPSLAAFRGSAGLDDVEAVCAGTIELGTPLLDAVQELLDQSLLLNEGRRRLHDMLAGSVGASRERAAGLNGAGWLALDQGDVEVSMDLLNERCGPCPRDR